MGAADDGRGPLVVAVEFMDEMHPIFSRITSCRPKFALLGPETRQPLSCGSVGPFIAIRSLFERGPVTYFH